MKEKYFKGVDKIIHEAPKDFSPVVTMHSSSNLPKNETIKIIATWKGRLSN